jgi:hypothetical protein
MKLSDRVLTVGGTVRDIEDGWQLLTIPNPIEHKKTLSVNHKESQPVTGGDSSHPIHKFMTYLAAVETHLGHRSYAPNQATIKKNDWVKCKSKCCRKYIPKVPRHPYCGDFCRTVAAQNRKTKNTKRG